MNPFRALRRLVSDVAEGRAAAVATSEAVVNLAALLNDKLSEVIAAQLADRRMLLSKLDALLASSNGLHAGLDRRLSNLHEASDNEQRILNDKLGALLASSAEQSEGLDRRLAELKDATDNEQRILNDKLGALLASSAQQNEGLDRRLSNLHEAADNEQRILNDKLGALLASSAEQSEGLDRRLSALHEAADNEQRILNDKLGALLASSATLDDKLAKLIEYAGSEQKLLARSLNTMNAALNRQHEMLANRSVPLANRSVPPTGSAEIADFYKQNGYVIFRGALPRAAIDELVQALEREVESSPGKFLRFPHNEYQINRYIDDISGRRVVANSLADPHRQPETPLVASAVRQLLCSDLVADLLASADGATSHTIHQTMLFFMSPSTEMHVDGWGLDSLPFGYSHTMWIPLERVTLLNGALALVPWPVGRVLLPAELGLGDSFMQGEDAGSRDDYHQYQERLADYIRRHDPVCVVPQLEPGDLVLFASLTPHRTLPGDAKSVSRKAIQVMLRDSSREWASWPQLLQHGTPNGPDAPEHRLQTVSPRWRMMM